MNNLIKNTKSKSFVKISFKLGVLFQIVLIVTLVLVANCLLFDTKYQLSTSNATKSSSLMLIILCFSLILTAFLSYVIVKKIKLYLYFSFIALQLRVATTGDNK